MSVKLSQVDFTRALLSADLIYPVRHAGTVELDLVALVDCEQALSQIDTARIYARNLSQAACSMLRQVVHTSHNHCNHLLTAVALNELACSNVGIGLAIDYLNGALEALLIDIETTGEQLTDLAASDMNTSRTGAVHDAEAFIAARYGNARICWELQEAAHLASLASRRRESDEIMGPRLQLRELIEWNLNQFDLLKRSELFQARILCIELMIKRKDWVGAEVFASMTMDDAVQAFGVDHWWHALFSIQYGYVLVQLGKTDEARGVLLQAQQALLEWAPDPQASAFREFWYLLDDAQKKLAESYS